MKNKKMWLIVAMTLTMTGCGGCTRVGPGYVGIVTKQVGSDRGVQDYPVKTGWVYYNMFTESVVEYPTFMQTVVWTANANEGKPINEEITFTNKDSMQISADISLAYQLDPMKVPAFYVQFRSDDLNHFTLGFLRNMAREKFDNVAGKYSIEQIMGDNAAMLADVRQALQKELDPIGVQIKQFGFIGAPRPPAAVIESINLKVKANQIAMQKQIEITQQEAEAKKHVADAEGWAKATILRADAEAEANRKVAASLSPTLVEWKKLEKWDGYLSQVSGAGSGILLNMQAK